MTPWLPDVPAPPHDPRFLIVDPKLWKPEIKPGEKFALSPLKVGAGKLGTTTEYVSKSIDSEIVGCVWHCLMLRVDMPRGTHVLVAAATSELPDDPNPDWVEHATATAAPNREWDALLRCPPGRYLQLKLTLATAGAATPAIERVKVEYPRISLRRYLPAVFGENPSAADFTDRMLAVIDTIFRSVEARLDAFPRYLDPMGVPTGKTAREDALGWLASWVGLNLDRTWDEARRRRWLKYAWLLYRERGTPRGLRRLLLIFLGWEGDPDDPAAPVLVLEHFRVRRWLHLGTGRLGDRSMLWGRRVLGGDRVGEARVNAATIECPPGSLRNDTADAQAADAHRFTVFVPAPVVRDPAKFAAVNRLVALAAPAHTAFKVELVEPRFRVGVQACVGFDTVVGKYPPAARLPVPELGRGTLLGNPLGGVTPLPRIGTAARVGVSSAIPAEPRTESTE